MTILEALEHARTLLETMGYRGGDIHDDLAKAIKVLQKKYPKAMKEELQIDDPDRI